MARSMLAFASTIEAWRLIGDRNFEIFFLENERRANLPARLSLTLARGAAGCLNGFGKMTSTAREEQRADRVFRSFLQRDRKA